MLSEASKRSSGGRGVFAGTAIGHRIRFQRRPQSPPIGGLPQGATYDFVTEDEPEVDERLLQALQGAAGATGIDDSRAGTSAGSKRHREEEQVLGSDMNAPNGGEPHKRRYGDETADRRFDGARYSPGSHERRGAVRAHEEGRHRHSGRDRFDRDGYGSRGPRQADRHATERREHEHGARRTDHERNGSSHRDRRDERRDRVIPDTYQCASAHDGGQDRGGKDRSGTARARETERSHKDKKSKKRRRDKKDQIGDNATLEDAVRFIVDQGLSAEDVLSELRGRKK